MALPRLWVPAWSVSKGTIDALLARGLVREGQRESNGYGTFLVEVLP